MFGRKTFSKEQFIAAVKNNYSVAGVLRELNLFIGGANYKGIKKLIKDLSLDNSHWTGQGHLKGHTHNWSKKTVLEEILCQNSSYLNTSFLKKRLLKEHLLNQICYNCSIDSWLGQKLSLHLDHINGCNTDNRLENLRLLCPNCHSLTDTYCGKNKLVVPGRFELATFTVLSGVPRPLGYGTTKKCMDCQKEISRKALRCKSCTTKLRPKRIIWPSIESLKEMLEKSNYTKLGRQLGVSDNAIKKHIKNHS